MTEGHQPREDDDRRCGATRLDEVPHPPYTHPPYPLPSHWVRPPPARLGRHMRHTHRTFPTERTTGTPLIVRLVVRWLQGFVRRSTKRNPRLKVVSRYAERPARKREPPINQRTGTSPEKQPIPRYEM